MRINRSLTATTLASLMACSINLANAAQGDLPQDQEAAGSADSGKSALPDPVTEGIRAGGFLLYPQISLSATLDDNIYATRQHQVDDLVFAASPSIEVKSDWEKHVFNLRAGATVSRYRDHGSEDTQDYWLEAEGRYDQSKRSNLFGGARHARYHEDRESPDAALGAEPTIYKDDMLYAGASHRINDRVSARIGGSLRKLNFDDSGAVNNDDRDRDIITGGVWLSYDLNATTQLLTQVTLDQRNYELPLDDGTPENRNSDGYRVQAGVKWKRGRVSGDAYAGIMAQDYKDATLKDVSTADFGASVAWKATERTTVHGVVERSIEETTLDGASSYINTGVSAGLTHRARPDLTFAAAIGLNNADYQGQARNDDFMEANVGLTYDITRRVYLAANYRYMHRDSNIDSADFYRNQIGLTLGAYP